MTSAWAFQDDALWQSCSAEAKARASAWEAQSEILYKKLAGRMAEQPLTSSVGTADMLQQILLHKDELAAQATRLTVLGTGGASLGAQALCALAEDTTKVTFLENCDPVSLAKVMQRGADSAWLIISKSGETVETLAAALSLIAAHGADKHLAAKVRVITENPQGTLGQLAVQQGWKIIAHPAHLGGRFSVFSVVGLLPVAFAGLDIAAIAATAQETMQQWMQTRDACLLRHAAWSAATMDEKPMHLLMAYADRLRPATQWFKQLWAESLGKGGHGQTPLTAIGAIDQHSQLQLYLDGPRDKLVTLWLPQVAGQGMALPKTDLPGLAYFNGRSMGDVMQATAEATATTLAKAGVSLRVARGVLSPTSLAEWFARQMMETLLVAIMIDVDPYSQPAVEDGKKLTRAALAGVSAQ